MAVGGGDVVVVGVVVVVVVVVAARSSTTESTGASVAAVASSFDRAQYGDVSSGTPATTSASAEQAASPANAGRRSAPVRIGRSSRRNDTTARSSVTAMRTAKSTASGQAGALLVEHDVDRPVVQVDAVADRAEGDERGPGEQAAQRRRDLQSEHQPGRRQGEQRQPALVRRAGARRPGQRGPGDDTDADDPEPGDRAGKRPLRPPAVEDDGEERADQDLAQPRRRRPVGGVTTPDCGDQRRGHRRGDGEGADDQHAAAPPRPQHDHHRQRPDPVELLLDRQRPVVVEWRADVLAARYEVGVGLPARQGDPVVDLGERRPEVPAQLVDAVEQTGPRQHDDAGEAGDTRREQPADASGVERPDVEPAVAIVLDQGERRDQVPRQGEEHRDADVSTVEPALVEHEHERDRQRPHPVERRLVGEARPARHGPGG